MARSSAGVAALLTPAAVSASTAPEQDVNAWALDYTGSPGGAAEGEPIRVGYANSEIFAPESTVGVRAAVEYVNAELGGAGGRPIELVECPVNTLEEGAACGAQFANDDSIALVLTGTIVVGQQGAVRRDQRQQAADHRQRRHRRRLHDARRAVVHGRRRRRRRRHGQVRPRGVPATDRRDHRQRQRRRASRRQRPRQADPRCRRSAVIGGVRRRHRDGARRLLGDAGRRRRHRRRVPLARVAVQLHQHVRQHALARHRPRRW